MINKYVYRPKKEIWGKEIEYVMNKEQFDALADTRGNKNINPYVYVIETINETYGLLGVVTSLCVEGEFNSNHGNRAKVALDDSIFF